MERIRSLLTSVKRPVLWGFFVSAILSVLLLGVQWYWRSSVQKNWSNIEQGREKQIQQIVSSAFYTRMRALLDVAATVRADRQLLDDVSIQSAQSILRAFELLDEHRTGRDIDIDIVDAVGNVVLWAGRSSEKNGDRVQPGLNDTLVFLTQSGLHSYLSVSLPIQEKFLSVVVSQALEVNYPISNRFVTPLSLANELAVQTGVDVRLELVSAPDSTDETSFFVPLKDFSAGTIGFAVLSKPTQETELLIVNAQIGKLLSVTAGVGALFLLWMLALFAATLRSPWVKGAIVSLLLWALRYAWLGLEFPHSLVGGSLFDAAHYASPFGSGLTSSLGETLLSVATLLVNVLFWFDLFVGWQRQNTAGPPSSRTWLYLLVFPGTVSFFYLTQGFGEAIRSFVFDSTLIFHDPTVLFPGSMVSVMYVIILLLTTAYLLLAVMLQFLMLTVVRKSFRHRLALLTEMLVIVAPVVLLWGILQLLPLTPKFPVYYPLLGFMVAAVFTSWFVRLSETGISRFLILSRTMGWMVAAALLLSVPLLDNKLHQKDRDYLQLLADELSRPVDSWLSLVVNDGLRVALNNSALIENIKSHSPERHSDVAFTLWSQSLLGREGYNSAVVLYDSSGSEISRFTVGLTSFEQTELLRTMFDAEEEVLQVVDRRVPGGAVKYYGAWSTLRDDDNRPVGFVAVILSANQQALFRGEAPEPLRTVTRERFDTQFRELTVSEFRNGLLTSTNNSRLYRGMHLREDVLQEFENSTRRFLWRNETIDGQEFEILYALDENRPGTVRTLTLEVPDIRWHVFNVVKIALVFASLLIVGIAVRFLVSWRRNDIRGVGFRGRLFIAFSLLTVLSLLLIGYYNRQLATERLESNINRRLMEDLNLLERRMIQTFLDEEDFLNGMTDDFCETVASEYGIDFSVYRSASLKASSRPELYHATILDQRLAGRAYSNTVLLGKNYFRDVEQVGEVQYAVGYKPLLFNDRIVGVIAVPSLYRQREIDEELAYRNSYTVGVYALILAVVSIVGLALANRLSRPLRQLSDAARKVGRGDLGVQLQPQTSDEVGELMASFTEMVKELKHSREQISRAERELAWKEMAKQVAHEIKNPLTPMKLSVQHLRTAFKDKAPDFESLVDRVTQTVIEQIDALSRIASEFSNFARMPERKFERVDVHHLLRETIGLFQEIRGIEFRANFSDTTQTLVADRDELRRVFINLIRNSVQAMEKGGAISLETSVVDHRCFIRLSDTGPGIPSNIQAKVFEPNFSTKTDGTGLGLAICRKIVEDLNGTIELESEVGKGTTFTITIPLQPAS